MIGSAIDREALCGQGTSRRETVGSEAVSWEDCDVRVSSDPNSHDRQLGTRSAIAVVVIALAFLVAPIGHATSLECDGIPVRIANPRPPEASMICQAASHTVRQLKKCGIEARSPLNIEVVQGTVRSEDLEVYGCFDRSTGSIQLLTLERCAEHLKSDETRPGLDAADYFQSIVVHEVAHGILSQQDGASELPRIAHEYLAYGLQIDSLAPKSRQGFLKPLQDRGQLRIELPHEILLMMNPPVFGAISYLHFKNSADQCATIKSVLKGDVIFPRIGE